ncbi:hypothetical protein ACH5RR_012443 [Cinchona calisaya]|uniref:Uncharacterized protein n=1 Tax=Cinchona calisaya TaxID=153742 RepID=A0ABD3A7T1_9GENT
MLQFKLFQIQCLKFLNSQVDPTSEFLNSQCLKFLNLQKLIDQVDNVNEEGVDDDHNEDTKDEASDHDTIDDGKDDNPDENPITEEVSLARIVHPSFAIPSPIASPAGSCERSG